MAAALGISRRHHMLPAASSQDRAVGRVPVRELLEVGRVPLVPAQALVPDLVLPVRRLTLR